MKRVLIWVMTVVLLCGCANSDKDLKAALDLRSRLQNAAGCSFDGVITADYGEMVYTFTMRCVMDDSGRMEFEVLEPETISGITGEVSGDKGTITFDETVLAFDTIADGYITPVVSPWVMVNALKSGYITSCGAVENGHRISLNDTYADDALQMDVWVDQEGSPVCCEILYKERKCLSIEVRSFRFM